MAKIYNLHLGETKYSADVTALNSAKLKPTVVITTNCQLRKTTDGK